MKIIDKLRGEQPAFSFEFFPPKDEEGVDRLFATISELEAYQPTYVSVTYGAGGSTRRLTVDLVTRIKRDVGLEAMAHLTCVGATRDEIAQVLDQLEAAGIENVLPLRGDPPRGETEFKKTAGGFAHASELVAFVRQNYSFCLAAACYPETHIEAPSPEADLQNLKRKVDAGVDLLITQLFFDNSDYYRFIDEIRSLGIQQPVIAGIMPVTGLNQVKRFTKLCGSKIPARLLDRLEKTGGEPEAVRAIGVEHATEQCQDLIANGVPGIHFYTLNRSPATKQILGALR